MALLSACAALALAATPACAKVVYTPLPLHFGAFSVPTDVTVDQSNGNVYVTNSGANTVEVFSEEGGSPTGVVSPLTGKPATGSAAPQAFRFGEGTSDEPSEVAIDEASGSPSYRDLYVSDAKHSLVDKFALNAVTHEYEYLCQYSGFDEPDVNVCVGEGATPTWEESDGVAVDQSNGNVYVASYGPGRGAVSEFSPNGLSLEQVPSSLFSGPVGVAVAPNGTLYVNGYQSKVVKVSPEPGREESVLDENHSTAVAVDAEENVFVDDRTYIAEYNKEGKLIDKFGEGTIADSEGVAVNDKTQDVYVSDRGHEDVEVFAPSVAPDCETGAPSGIHKVSAAVSGTVNPDSAGEAEYFFQYGETFAYGQETSATSVPNGSAGVPVEADLSSLTPGTVYHYRLVAKNTNGIDEECGESEFMALPAVTLGRCKTPPPPLTFTATLCVLISPEGAETSYFFEYGENEGYGGQTTTLVTSAGSKEEEFTVPIEGLQPSTTYHYRVVAESTLGSTQGSDQTFTTLPVIPAVNDHPLYATGIAPHEATLHGSVNPGSGVTTYRFQYGESAAAYSASTPEAYTQLNSEDDAAEQLITGLQPGTVYHYRLVATNAAGTTEGPDETFTTLPSPPPAEEVVAPSGPSLEVTSLPSGFAQPGTPALLPVPVFPPERVVGVPILKCKKGYVKKDGRCVKHRGGVKAKNKKKVKKK